jgi:60 kDa SS-A/Ro ribonucleoprotein
LKDIVKMVHPKPESESRQAFFGYLLGREVDEQALPALVRQFERFKAGQEKAAPDLPLVMLTSLPLKQSDWVAIALNASWQTLRMNLNTFLRHGVFEEPGMDRRIAKRLRDPREIAKARVFPYQLLSAYQMAGPSMPAEIREALHEAMELAVANVPVAGGQVYVCPDVSGSMRSPITGYRRGAASAVTCVDVAALVAAAVLRKNRKARVIPFEQTVVTVPLNAEDSILQNAARLAKVGGGGTNCSAPIELLNKEKAHGDLVIFVSDNESWVDAGRGRGTALMSAWDVFRRRNPKARLVCIDLQANETTQAHEREDVLNIGGFSDHVFEVISDFAAGRLGKDHWTGLIEAVAI